METTHREMAQAWLGLQCSMVAGVSQAVIVLNAPEAGGRNTVAAWPQNTAIPPGVQQAAKQAIAERRRILDRSEAPEAAPAVIAALPLLIEGRLLGAFAVAMSDRSEQKQRAALQVFAWGTAWLEILLRHQRAAAESHLQMMLEVIAQAVSAERPEASAMAAVNELARRLGCERATLGILDGQDVRIDAISDTSRIDNKVTLVRSIAAVMHEAIDQDCSIVVPVVNADAHIVVHAHQALVRQLGERAVCTVPLIGHGQGIGALTLERAADRPFDAATVEVIEALAMILGPLLDSKLRQHLSLPVRLKRRGRQWLEHLFGPGHSVVKAATLSSLLMLLLVVFVEGEYRIDARASLEGRVQRAVVAPFEGFLAEAGVRAGDIVEQGQVLCRIEDRDLQLEHAKWSSEQAQLLQAQREALANHDRGEISILGTRLQQVQAKLDLTAEKLARTRLIAPLAGLVVSGDLSQSLGMPLERGQVLFEIAPLDSYRIMLEVDERDIAHLAAGQRGRLALAGLPHDVQAFTVQRILPIAAAADGKNFFKVEAVLEEDHARLRPGMQGVGKIDAGQRKLLWIWTHRMVDWFRLLLWRWLG